MNKHGNLYPEMIADEGSGISVPNIAHRIWLEGYIAGREEAATEGKRWELNREKHHL